MNNFFAISNQLYPSLLFMLMHDHGYHPLPTPNEIHELEVHELLALLIEYGPRLLHDPSSPCGKHHKDTWGHSRLRYYFWDKRLKDFLHWISAFVMIF
jgi:hypothetical protein